MTIEEARKLRYGQIVYEHENKNKKGESKRWRVNGQVKIWKRDPSRIQVPMKHGLYEFGYLDEHNLHLLDVK